MNFTAADRVGAIGGYIGAVPVLANLLGGLTGGMVNNCGTGCSENMLVNRYEAAQSARIAELETEVKLRDANTYTDGKLGDLRNYMENKFDRVERELCDQRTYNATNTAALGCMSSQISQLFSLTQLKIPNSSVCPGWGDVTVSVTPATGTAAG